MESTREKKIVSNSSQTEAPDDYFSTNNKIAIPKEKQRLIFSSTDSNVLGTKEENNKIEKEENNKIEKEENNNQFLTGAQKLLSDIDQFSQELQFLKKKTEELKSQMHVKETDLNDLKLFTQNLYTQLLYHHDFVHNGHFDKNIERIVTDTITQKYLPEVWKLKHTVTGLSEGLNQTKENVKEDSLLEEKIQHLEIIGNSTYSDGTRARKMITETELRLHPVLGPRVEWESHTSSQTVNENMEQIAKMFDVVLKRTEQINENLTKKIDHLEKKVDIIHTLYNSQKKNEKILPKN